MMAPHCSSLCLKRFPCSSFNTHLALTGRRSEEKNSREGRTGGKSKGERLTAVSLNCALPDKSETRACDEVQKPVTCYSHSTLSRRPREDTIFQDRWEHGAQKYYWVKKFSLISVTFYQCLNEDLNPIPGVVFLADQ